MRKKNRSKQTPDNEDLDDGPDYGLGDLLKKLVNTGLGAAMVTEEALKGFIGEMPLPKEIVHGLLKNAKNTKEEIIKSVNSGVKDYLNHLDLRKEIDRVLDNYDIEVKANVTFKKKSQNTSYGENDGESE